MGLFSMVLSPFFSKVFISINIDASSCFIKIIRTKNGIELESLYKEFKTSEGNLPMEAIKIIRRYKKKYPFTYVCAMLKCLAQGVVLQKNNKIFFSDKIKPSECEIVQKSNIAVFAKKTMIKDFLKRYHRINAIDFLFSPFLLINENVQNYPTLGNNMYVLLQRSNIALMIVKKHNVCFSGFFIAQGEVHIIDREEQKSSMELKNFDDFFEDFDDFSNIEPNASIDKLQTDMFIPNLDEKNKIVYDDMPKAVIISKIILDSIKEYYQNPIYEGEFIDKVIFLDACKISDIAFEHISKTIMIETIKRDFDLNTTLIEFAKKELGVK